MKLLTIVVPCYNSEEYIQNAINSLIVGRDYIEIIIVNDGSKDNTLKVANMLKEKYPDLVKVIDKPNGGHGDAVISGLEVATGKYFKVLDSDDWFDKNSFIKVLDKLDEFEKSDISVDMILANYVYEKQGARHKKVIKYNNVISSEKILKFSELGRFRTGQYILMHSVIYNTAMLKRIKLTLPKHTFYVDNIYVYYPLPHVKSIYYIDTDLYRYYIGREDQSVNESIMISRVDQQIRVTKLMIDMYNLQEIDNKPLRKYMINYLNIMMTVSSILLIIQGSKESLNKKNDLWQYLYQHNKYEYKLIRHSFLGRMMNVQTKFGRKIAVLGYKVARLIVGFN